MLMEQIIVSIPNRSCATYRYPFFTIVDLAILVKTLKVFIVHTGAWQELVGGE